MSLDLEDDVFGNGGSNFLSPSPNKHSRKSPSKLKGMKAQRSSSSLRPGSNFGSSLEDEGGDGMHSLAHELAAALMPGPSAGQMLADELGLEFDEGAEGIDEQPAREAEGDDDTLAQQLNGHAPEIDIPTFEVDSPSDELARHFGSMDSPVPSSRGPPPRSPPAQDPLDVLSRDIESTETLLSSLRRLDIDVATATTQPSLEKVASDIIRHINETVRDREGQVRELMDYEREFRKISGEVGGDDVLSRLDELHEVDGLLDSSSSLDASQSSIKTVEANRPNGPALTRQTTSDWEINPDHNHLGDDDAFSEIEPESPSPIKDVFATPSITGPPSAATAIPLFTSMRSVNTSLAASLNILSEQAQMNGAANSDAGRKIRALKNKLGGWRAEWDSAERSRVRIERWESGLSDDDPSTPPLSSPPHKSITSKRIDGRTIVAEQLEAFKIVLADAGMKTQAIMARS
ncbi:hypothetical protein SCHPADRAFT_899176 [Schizopora paradoxa]|uniref:Uncharacterized protein n=1 Tax=Schizopora paradoxa TaxID=27342 RepID=A0A0H2S4J9_9AGAM|nr:hypothetical protein SCHPADRAFT_899176 [Schizopora paradoxa]